MAQRSFMVGRTDFKAEAIKGDDLSAMSAPRPLRNVCFWAAAAMCGCEVPNPAYDVVLRVHDAAVVANSDDGPSIDASLWAPDAMSIPRDAALEAPATFMAQIDLAAYWRFDEGSGTVAHDEGPLRMQTNLQGALWLTSPALVSFANRAALTFDGTSAMASTTDARLSSLANPFTLSFWCRPARGGTGSREALITLAQPAAHTSFHVGRYRDGRLAVWTFGGVELVPGPVPTTGVWQHVAYTWDGSLSRLWLNGDATDSSNRGPGSTVPTSIMFGGITNAEPYGGALDEIRIYKRALAASDIAALANGAY